MGEDESIRGLLGSSLPLATPTVTVIPRSINPNETTAQKPVANVVVPEMNIIQIALCTI